MIRTHTNAPVLPETAPRRRLTTPLDRTTISTRRAIGRSLREGVKGTVAPTEVDPVSDRQLLRASDIAGKLRNVGGVNGEWAHHKGNMGPSETGAARHLTEVETLSRLAVESLPAAAIVIRSGGAIALVNRQIERLFGYSREDLIGQPIDLLLPGALDDVPTTVAARPRSASRRVGRQADGSRLPVYVGLDTIHTEHGTFVLAAVVEISARTQSDDDTGEAIDDEIEFERLIAELSVQFINLPGDRVDAAIRDALRRIGEGLDLDRCDFRKIQPDGLLLEPVSWIRAGFPEAPAQIGGPQSFPWGYGPSVPGRWCASRAWTKYRARRTGTTFDRSASRP